MIEKIIYRVLDEDKPKEMNKTQTNKKSKKDYNSLLVPKQNFYVYNNSSKQTYFLKMQEDLNVDVQAMMLQNAHLRVGSNEKSDKKEKKRNNVRMKTLKITKTEKVEYFDNLNKSKEEKYIYLI